jgi:hypothetical protein
MGAFSPYSYYHGWCFPKNMAFYNNLVCMEDVSRETIEDWKEIYLYLLKKVTFDLKGKRLVLKNQDNTAKIKLLLEMFPNAKFILIQRNPYHLYLSMMRFMTIVIPLYCIQTPPGIEDVERMMMELYARMFKKYLDERSHIPKGNLVEIKYETFLQQPLEELRRTYSELELDGFTESEQAFREYVQSQKSVKTHQYNIDDALRKKIIEKWDFIFEAFGYDQ